MGIAERIYEAVKSLPESMASEVLDYVEGKRARSAANDATVRRTAALALLDKHAGKFKTVKCNRADLYDRAGQSWHLAANGEPPFPVDPLR